MEDNERDAELVQRALHEHKLANNLVHCKDGQEALDWLFGRGAHAGRDIEQHPKVILLDLKLPKVDGLEVLREIRSNRKTRELPVVVMTSSREERDLMVSYQLGVNSYIVKPMEFESFSNAVVQAGYYWLLVNEKPQLGVVEAPEPITRKTGSAG